MQRLADKAQALASYARQADNDDLRKMADRIQARAIRRCGELLREWDGRGRPEKNNTGADTILSQREVGKNAGKSARQVTIATRVTNIPALEFEKAVGSDDPPTVAALAERGIKKRPEPLHDLKGRTHEDFQAMVHAQGQLHLFAEFCSSCDQEAVLRGSEQQNLELIKEKEGISKIIGKSE